MHHYDYCVTQGYIIITALKIMDEYFIDLEIKESALSPGTSSRLIQMQNEVFRLQRPVLEYKLSSRDLVINTFNSNNWGGFFLVLAGEEIGVTIPELYISKH